MVTQTSVQKAAAIRFGSGKLEVGATVGTLADVGAIRNATFAREFEKVEIMSDNADRIAAGIRDHFAIIEFDMLEIDMSKLSTIMGGLDTYATVDGTPVAVVDEPITLNGTDAVRIANKMGDGTELAGIVVTNAAAVAAVRNTDYVISVDASGYTTIARVAASTKLTDGGIALIDYSYTPNASVTLKSGGNTTIADKVVRITNTNAAGKTLQITAYKASIDEGWSYDFPADDAYEVGMVHIKMKARIDTTRTVGDQLFAIVDEQGV